jgi:hypothetical protein
LPDTLVEFGAHDVSSLLKPDVADPTAPLFADRFLVEGYGFLWLEIFLDGFNMSKSRGALATEGVYVALSNTRRDSRHAQSLIGTLFVAPHGISAVSLLKHVSKDILALQRGYQVYDALDNRWLKIRGAVSMLLSDHVQALKNTRSLSTNSRVTGRCCWSTLANRCQDSTLGRVLEHDMTRREDQTDVCVQQMRETMSSSRQSDTKLKRIQKQYGIRLAPRMFSVGVHLDSHLQSPWDPSHLLFLNILPRLLDVAHMEVPSKSRSVFLDRMNQFFWARGMTNTTTPYRKGLGRSCAISVWRQHLTAAVYACDGLVKPPLLKLVTEFWKLACLVMRSAGLSVEDVKSAQNLCDSVIPALLRLGGTKKNHPELRKFDLPCVHGLEELCYRTLPALRNGNFSSTNSFETHHKDFKAFGVGGTREITSFNGWLTREALQRCLHGMAWGTENQFRLGAGWTAKKLREPIFLSLTPFAGLRSCFEERAWTRTLGSIEGDVDPMYGELILAQLREQFQVDDDDVTMTLLSGFIRHTPASTEDMRQGDAVEVNFEGERAFAILSGPFVEVSWEDEVRLFVFPTWYKDFQERDQTHRLRGTKLVERYIAVDHPSAHDPQPPIRPEQIIDRVHVVHSCKRACTHHQFDLLNCSCTQHCYVRTVCCAHEQEHCQSPSCVGKTVRLDWHNPARNVYEVLTKSQGVSFHRKRNFYSEQ